MTADALLGERLIAMALLKPGHESLYHTLHAPIYRIAGLGRIVDSATFDDGTYNLVLHGQARVRIVEELIGRPYRFARIQVLESVQTALDVVQQGLRSDLLAEAMRSLGETEEAQRRWRRLAASTADLAELTDIVAAGLPIEVEQRQALLEELEPEKRAEHIIQTLKTLGAILRTRRGQSLGGQPHQN
jgi:Lon protease-like protein